MIYNPLNKRIIHTIVLFLFLFTQIDCRAESERHYSAVRSAYMPWKSVCLIYGMGTSKRHKYGVSNVGIDVSSDLHKKTVR